MSSMKKKVTTANNSEPGHESDLMARPAHRQNPIRNPGSIEQAVEFGGNHSGFSGCDAFQEYCQRKKCFLCQTEQLIHQRVNRAGFETFLGGTLWITLKEDLRSA